ncbi:hypothetical protein D3C71_1385260 [compost metagenome]
MVVHHLLEFNLELELLVLTTTTRQDGGVEHLHQGTLVVNVLEQGINCFDVIYPGFTLRGRDRLVFQTGNQLTTHTGQTSTRFIVEFHRRVDQQYEEDQAEGWQDQYEEQQNANQGCEQVHRSRLIRRTTTVVTMDLVQTSGEVATSTLTNGVLVSQCFSGGDVVHG